MAPFASLGRHVGRATLTARALVLVVCAIVVSGAGYHGPPTSPDRVLDGDRAGIDVDESESSLHFAATWSRSTDETGQRVVYEMCLRERTERCTDEHWFVVSDTDSRVEAGTLQMMAGDWLLSCIRARDVEGNYSAEVCSDGFRVTPADSEIRYVMRDRADAGLPSDRKTVERLAASGAFGDTWANPSVVPHAADEKPDFTSLEFQTWTLDHGTAASALIGRGIIPTVPAGTNVLEVAVAARACSPREELRRALGASVVDAAPTPPAAVVHQRPTDRGARALMSRYVLMDPAYRKLDIERVEYVRRGVAYHCIEAMSAWFARPEVRVHLSEAGFPYVNATLGREKVIISSDEVRDLPGESDVIDLRSPIRGSSMPA